MAEQDKKNMGVVFRMHDDAGIARISITNTTTSTVVLNNKDVDLYDVQYDGSAGVYDLYCFWWNVSPATDAYSIQVELSPLTAVGRYLEIEYYLDNTPLTDASVSSILTTYHSTYPTHDYHYGLVQSAVTPLTKIEYFNGDGTTKVFTLAATNHAHEFVTFSYDGGTTWKQSTDSIITWGSNALDYDDDTIDATGKFSINFLTAPITGVSNVAIKFLPMVTNYYITRTLFQPNTTTPTSYIDYQHEVRLMDDALELIP